jgi:hypothetical protein
LHQFPAHLHHTEGMVIPIRNIMAFIQMTPADEYPVHPVRKSSKDKSQIDSAAAHYTDQLNIGCVLLSGNSS